MDGESLTVGAIALFITKGVGHSIGLPHPDEGNRSVMSLGQYHGWINESFVDKAQNERIGWKATSSAEKPSLFSALNSNSQTIGSKTT